ncbi:hypothetical protein PSJ8397_02239 [Pseudooctadecabacter jejudonensis]|uniref:Uncharacterized protein n=1 Tax=Pseudooctadecabacter jejudonensis TaxID=1391910 RepID=A0A1Y5SLJ9_9RHOB|nr:hypothetical protein PSJ8397_02239 [Pseudooctadecabacter jejudonensis]
MRAGEGGDGGRGAIGCWVRATGGEREEQLKCSLFVLLLLQKCFIARYITE